MAGGWLKRSQFNVKVSQSDALMPFPSGRRWCFSCFHDFGCCPQQDSQGGRVRGFRQGGVLTHNRAFATTRRAGGPLPASAEFNPIASFLACCFC